MTDEVRNSTTRTLRGSSGGWGWGVIWLHWITATLLLLVLAVGYIAEHATTGAGQIALYELQFSLGLVTMLLIVIRLGWRMTERGPRDADRHLLARWAARVVHGLLYLSAVAALGSGWVNFMFLGPVRVFGIVDIPRLFDPVTQEPMRALSWYVHHYSWQVMLLLVCAHVAGALWHHFAKRDRVLLDFLPSLGSAPPARDVETERPVSSSKTPEARSDQSRRLK